MKQKHFIFLFVIFACTLFLMPHGVEADEPAKRIIHTCYYEEAGHENSSIGLLINEDFTYTTILGNGPYLDGGVALVNSSLDINNWNNSCPRYASIYQGNIGAGIMYTPENSWRVVFTNSQEEAEQYQQVGGSVTAAVGIRTLKTESTPSICYYDVQGKQTTVDNAAFQLYESLIFPYIGIQSNSMEVHLTYNILEYTSQMYVLPSLFYDAQVKDGTVFVNFSTFHCIDQVYLVRDDDGSYNLYSDKSLVPDGAITTADTVVDPSGMNQDIACETLFDFDDEGSVGWFLQKILDYIKIFAPIAVVLLSSIDFIKAIFSSDEKATKQAQQKLVIRLVCALALFLVPTLVQFLLRLINGLSNPTCGFH